MRFGTPAMDSYIININLLSWQCVKQIVAQFHILYFWKQTTIIYLLPLTHIIPHSFLPTFLSRLHDRNSSFTADLPLNIGWCDPSAFFLWHSYVDHLAEILLSSLLNLFLLRFGSRLHCSYSNSWVPCVFLWHRKLFGFSQPKSPDTSAF